MPFAPAQFPVRQRLMNGQAGRIYSRPQWPNMPSRETVFPMGPMADSMLRRAANGLNGYVRVPEPFVPGARGLGSVMDAVRRQPLMFGLAAVLVAFSGWGLWSVMRKRRKPARNAAGRRKVRIIQGVAWSPDGPNYAMIYDLHSSGYGTGAEIGSARKNRDGTWMVSILKPWGWSDGTSKFPVRALAQALKRRSP
jgi:hypothetical protein